MGNYRAEGDAAGEKGFYIMEIPQCQCNLLLLYYINHFHLNTLKCTSFK